jgi:O-antigen ligase
MGQIPWFIFAEQAPLDAQAGGLAIFILSSGILILAAHRFREEKWLHIFTWVFIFLGAGYILGRAIRFPYIDIWYNPGFAAGSMFWTWLVAMALSQAVFNPTLKTSVRVLLYLLVVLTFYVALNQAYDWKSGWLPPLLSVSIILGWRFKRLFILIIPIALVTTSVLTTSLILTDQYSWGTRVDAWLIVLEISKLNPFLGLGFSNYYWYTPLYPIRGWSVNFNSHSQYIDLIAQTGIIGLACFLWIFIEAIRLNWRLMNKLPGGFPQSYSVGTFAGIAGTLLAAFLVDWVLPFVYNIGFSGFRASILPWIFLGGLISLDQLYGNTDNTTLLEKSE